MIERSWKLSSILTNLRSLKKNKESLPCIIITVESKTNLFLEHAIGNVDMPDQNPSENLQREGISCSNKIQGCPKESCPQWSHFSAIFLMVRLWVVRLDSGVFYGLPFVFFPPYISVFPPFVSIIYKLSVVLMTCWFDLASFFTVSIGTKRCTRLSSPDISDEKEFHYR